MHDVQHMAIVLLRLHVLSFPQQPFVLVGPPPPPPAPIAGHFRVAWPLSHICGTGNVNASGFLKIPEPRLLLA